MQKLKSRQKQIEIKVIDSALNGEEGIEKLKVQKPDVVLLDINMPGKNGIDTCKEMLKIAPDTKVVAISMHKESSLIKLMLKTYFKVFNL